MKYRDLLYDVGMHRGEDAEFYLRKGFRVIGFDADCRGSHCRSAGMSTGLPLSTSKSGHLSLSRKRRRRIAAAVIRGCARCGACGIPRQSSGRCET